MEQKFEGEEMKEIAMNLLFEWSISELLDYFLEDKKLKSALLGQVFIYLFLRPSLKGSCWKLFISI